MPELQRDQYTLGGVCGSIKKEGNREYVFAYVPASTAVGTPLALTFTGVAGTSPTNPSAVAVATSSAYQLTVFPTVLNTAAGFQWCQYKGDATVLVDGTTDVAVSDFLEVINAGTSLVKDGTARTVNSVAIAQAARTTNSAGLLAVYLLGDRVIHAGS
jgi:hypothetical protein